ncbi:hypothetical protein GCM10022221_04990 [Actinocorallia aurea]
MKQRDPRAHWFLIGLGSLLLAVLLLLDGFVQGVVGETKNVETAGGGLDGPAQLTEAGAVVDTGQGAVQSARMPDKTIALTFDDGPDPKWTPQILDVLAEYDAKASFFMIGGHVARYPELARRVLDEGHEIGNHTYSHVDLATSPEWRIKLELSLTQRALAGTIGVKTRLMRMPYSGSTAGATEGQWRATRIAGEQGYIVVYTDRDTKDWERPGVPFMVAEALENTDSGEGAIIMLHDSGGDRSQTVQALREFIPLLQAKGYRFTTLAEALELPRAEVTASVRSQLAGKLIVNSQRVAHFSVDVLGILFLVGGALGLIRIVFLMVVAVRHARATRRGRKVPGIDDDPPSLTVIVPAYNEEVGIAATIASLRDTDFSGDLRIIVVDDGSTDRTAEIVRGLAQPGLTLITKANGGKPSALNAGIAHATSEILVMVDGDTVFQRDTLRKIVRPFRDPRVGAVSGNAKVANRRGILGRWQHIEYVIGFNLDRRMFDVFDCMPTVPGAIGAFRTAALHQVGGVSEETLAEDTDLTMAINRAGYRVAYEESAIAWTEAPGSLGQLWRQRYRWCYGTMQAMWKHKPWFRVKNGRRCLSYLVLFQVFFPLLAPAVDVFALHALLFGDRGEIALIWVAFVGVQLLGGALALILDKERLTPLWTLPLQQIVYRQLMYLIVIQSLVTAVLGSRLRWQTMERAGTFNEPGAVVPMVVTDTGPIAVPAEFRRPKTDSQAIKVAGSPVAPVEPLTAERFVEAAGFAKPVAEPEPVAPEPTASEPAESEPVEVPAPRDGGDPTRTMLDSTSLLPLRTVVDRAEPPEELDTEESDTEEPDTEEPQIGEAPTATVTAVDEPVARPWWEDDADDEEPADPRPWWEDAPVDSAAKPEEVEKPEESEEAKAADDVEDVPDGEGVSDGEEDEWVPLDPPAPRLSDATMALPLPGFVRDSGTGPDEESEETAVSDVVAEPVRPVSTPRQGSVVMAAARSSVPEPPAQLEPAPDHDDDTADTH